MTDDEMDVRLHAAGAAWRTATDVADPAPHDLSPEELLEFGSPARERRRHRTAWLATAAAVAAVLVAGGGFLLGRLGDDHGHRTAAAESAALENTTWQLLGYDGESLRQSSLATFTVRGGAFVADDSCDLYNGTAKVTGDRLHLADIEDRFYRCTDAVGEMTFQRGLATLQHDPRFSVDGDRLTISGAGPTLHLAAAPNLPAPTPDRPTLTGATWMLVKVVDGQGVEHAVRRDAELRIDGSHFSASDTCNSISGAVRVDYPVIGMSEVATTAVGCSPADTSDVVDAVLAGEARVDFRDTTLTVTKDGAGTLMYRWQPDDEQSTDPKRLAATDWQLRSINGVPANGMTLRTADGRLELAAACASTNVPVVLGPGTVYAPGLAKEPKNECPPERTDVIEMLATTPALWRIAGHQLIVNHAGSQGFSLVFDAAKDVPAAAAELPGEWKLSSVERNDVGSASGSGSSDTGVTLTVTADYRITVVTGCATVHGSWTVQGRNISHDPGTLWNSKGCSSFESTALEGTVGAQSWSIDHGQLVLTDGGLTVRYER